MTEAICFTITGPALTRIARDLVRERKWQEATRLLVESLLPDFTYEMAIDVLMGKKYLKGDSNVGMDLVQDTQKGAKEYREHLEWLYGGTYRDRSHNVYMQPYAQVTSWAAQDLGGPPGRLVNRWCPTHVRGTVLARGSGNDNIWRSLYYMDDPVNDCALEIPDEYGRVTIVLFKLVSEAPIWVKVYVEPQAALEAWLKRSTLDTRGGAEKAWRDPYPSLDGRLDDDFGDLDDELSSDEVDPTKVSLDDGAAIVDAYLKDPDATTASLAKDANKASARLMGKEEPDDSQYDEKNNGWLDPNGKFYGCKYGLHISAADKLGHCAKTLERKGWAKLTKSEWWWDRKLTPFQVKAIGEWCIDRGEPMPAKLAEKLVEAEGRL